MLICSGQVEALYIRRSGRTCLHTHIVIYRSRTNNNGIRIYTKRCTTSSCFCVNWIQRSRKVRCLRQSQTSSLEWEGRNSTVSVCSYNWSGCYNLTCRSIGPFNLVLHTACELVWQTGSFSFCNISRNTRIEDTLTVGYAEVHVIWIHSQNDTVGLIPVEVVLPGCQQSVVLTEAHVAVGHPWRTESNTRLHVGGYEQPIAVNMLGNISAKHSDISCGGGPAVNARRLRDLVVRVVHLVDVGLN